MKRVALHPQGARRRTLMRFRGFALRVLALSLLLAPCAVPVAAPDRSGMEWARPPAPWSST